MGEMIGKQIELGIGVENTRGTAGATAEKWIKKITANIVPKVEKKVDESTMNVLSDSLGARVVKKWFEGDLEGNLQADMIGYILYNLYGSVTSTLVTGSVYNHTFTTDMSIQHPSLSLYAKDGANSQEAISNVMVNSLEINASVDDYVKFTASFIGKDSDDNSDTPSYDTEYDFVSRDVSIKMADTSGGLSEATAIKVKDLSIKWDQALISDQVVGSYFSDDIYNTQENIEVTFNLNYDDDTYKDLFTANTYKYVEIKIEGEADLGSTNYPTLTLTLYRAQVMDWNREDGAGGDLVTQPITLKAFYNTTDEKVSQLVLKNLTSEYDEPLS